MPTVRHSSVVVVSGSVIDPQSINSETLKSAHIIPTDWLVGNQINSPVFALTQYKNGVSIQTEGNRCIFQQVIGGSLPPDSAIHNIARKYLESTKLVSYSAVGINWLLNITPDDPTEWIREQLGYGEKFSGFSPTSLQITKPWGLAVCNLVFRVEKQTVVVDCNYHFQLSSSLQPMAALDKWQLCKAALEKEVLPALPD